MDVKREIRRRRNCGFIILAALGANIAVAAAQEVVVNSNASGAGSLSQAITAANSNPDSIINFTISGQAIDQNVALPTLTVPATINGGTGNTLVGDGITPVLNVNFGSGTFTFNTLTVQATTGAAALGTNDNGTSGNSPIAGGIGGPGVTGAAGGTGLHVVGTTTLTLNGTLTGGTGGSANGGSANGGSTSQNATAGGAGGTGGPGGTGGAGGSGATLSSSNVTVTNSGTITGGNGGSANGGDALGGNAAGTAGSGGDGGISGPGGTGGAGGAGLVLSGANIGFTNSGTIAGGSGGSANSGNAQGGNATGTGGNGGAGGVTGPGGTGGQGGNGVTETGPGFLLINTGTILHGANGSAMAGSAAGGTALSGPAGADGISGPNGSANFGGGAVVVNTDAATIIDSGTISGGNVSDAIDFTGTNNTIELEAGYSIAGNVYASQSGNLLELGGSADATFDASRTDQSGANQFLNIVNFVKTGTSTWTLLNTSTRPTNWFIDQGTLEITSDAGLGTGNSVVLRGGELLTDQVGGFSTTRTVNLQGNGTIAAVLGTNPNYYGLITIQSPGTDTLTVGDATNNASIAFRNAVSNGVGTLSLNIVNGTLSLDGANSYSGGTTISGGDTIVVANTTTALGSGTVTLSGGSLFINASIVATGALTGTGGILSSGTGGTLLIQDNLAPVQTFSGTIENEGPNTIQIEKAGPGTEIFTSANTYTGSTTLISGTLGAGNPQAFGTGSFTNNGGTLEMAAGNHTLNIGGSFTQNSGTTLLGVLNGASSELITVGSNGHLGGNLTVDLAALSQPGTRAGTTPFTLITTDAGLNGSTFTSTSFQNAPSGAGEMISYTADDVVLNVTTSSAVLFPTTSLNGNQQGVLGAINENLLGGTQAAAFSTIDSALADLYATNPGALGSALDQLSPQAFGQFSSVTAFNNASFETEAMDNYLANQRGADGNFLAGNGNIDSSALVIDDSSYDPNLAMIHSRMLAWSPAPTHGVISDVANPVLGGVDMKAETNPSSLVPQNGGKPWNVFVRGSVVLAQGSSSLNTPHFDDNTESVVLGADYRISPHFLVGLTGAYAHTDANLDNNGSSATVDSYSPGLYASYADKGWYANLTGNYIFNNYTQDRVIGFLGQTAHSAPDGNEGVANLDGGYDFHRGAWTFGPLAGLQYTHLSVNGYDESGSAANLSVNEQDADSLRSRLGGRVSFAFANGGIHFTPHLDVSWQHEFMDQSRGITSQFDFGGGSFAVQTVRPSRDSALIDLGLDADLNRTVTVFGNYEVQAGQENYFGQSVQAGVKIGF